ncbi:MAG TPA: NUDIX domain-containing protein [Caulobacteraceae bacterium]|jgi:ADP-ribose pyrophosphatase YjhB (NUDIX family)
MDLDQLAAAFAASLDRRDCYLDTEVRWPQARLRCRVVVGDHDWPAELVTSARAVVFKGSKVVVVSESGGTNHVEPGGGLEPGETVEQALRRELSEETGWSVGELTPLGFHFFEPLTPKPAGSTRRWGPFVHPIFVTEALSYRRAARDMTQIETGSRLTPIRRALAELADDQSALLRAALERRVQR